MQSKCQNKNSSLEPCVIICIRINTRRLTTYVLIFIRIQTLSLAEEREAREEREEREERGQSE